MIEARGLSKRYGDKVAVDDLSFTVRPGRVTGFLGPNGAGKTTTMRMILGLDRPTAGSVTVNGKPFAELYSAMREVGALLDATAVHGGRSAYRHLLCLAQTNGIPRTQVDEVIGTVGLEDVAGKRSKGFSLGMSQRLGIAAALLGDPDVLMFDEPVNGLDPEGIRWIRLLMQSLAAEGRTVFVSSHLMSVRLAGECPADVVVMDVRMPELDGVAATREICSAGERPRVLILTTFDLDEYAFAALRAGASGFLLKSAPPEELLYAIRCVHKGDAVVAPSTTRRLIGQFLPHLPPTHHPHPLHGPPPDLAELTAREREVLASVGCGLSNTEIATLLTISEATVKTHVGHIMAKLGLRDRIQTVVYAYETGVITPQGRQAVEP